MIRWERGLERASLGFNAIASAAILFMMGLTCVDVVLRLLRRPIPGTYELVGFLGALVIAFSLAYTSLERGHIAVEILAMRLSRRMQSLLEGLAALAGILLFGLLTWQSLRYAADLRQSGEVSLTLAIPLHPVVFGIAAGSGLLCLVLLADLVKAVRRLAS